MIFMKLLHYHSALTFFLLRYTNADLKIPYMLVFIWKHYPEDFVILILRILELFPREIC